MIARGLARCRVCHRPLTDPKSVAREIGPVCRGNVGDTLDQLDFWAESSAWIIISNSADWVIIRDVGHGDGYKTVTNDAAAVVAELAPVLGGRRLFYIDSSGRLDELIVEAGRFAGFAAGAPAAVREAVGL